MRTEEKIKRLEERIEQLEKLIAYLEGKPAEKTDRQKLPVNPIAFQQAMAEWFSGNRKSLDKYCQHYRIPT